MFSMYLGGNRRWVPLFRRRQMKCTSNGSDPWNKEITDSKAAMCKQSCGMKKCISFRAAGTSKTFRSMLLRGSALSCRVLRLSKVVVESAFSNRLDCINIKKSWNEILYLFSS